MRYILLISFAALISFVAADLKDDKHRFQEECKEETGLDEDKFENIRETGIMDEWDRTQEEYIKCVALKMNLIEEDGRVKMYNLQTYLLLSGVRGDIIYESFDKCLRNRQPEYNPGLFISYNKCFANYVPKDVLIVAA